MQKYTDISTTKVAVEKVAEQIATDIFNDAKRNSTTLVELEKKLEATMRKEFGGTTIQYPMGAMVQYYIRELKSTMKIIIK